MSVYMMCVCMTCMCACMCTLPGAHGICDVEVTGQTFRTWMFPPTISSRRKLRPSDLHTKSFYLLNPFSGTELDFYFIERKIPKVPNLFIRHSCEVHHETTTVPKFLFFISIMSLIRKVILYPDSISL